MLSICDMCPARFRSPKLLQRHLLLAHGSEEDRACGIAALKARRQQRGPVVTTGLTTNETVLVCRPRLPSTGDSDNTSDSSSDSDSASESSDRSSEAEPDADPRLPPLTPPRVVPGLPELFPGEGENHDVVDDATRSKGRPAFAPIKIASIDASVRYRDELPDPRLHFLGAPSVTSSGAIAAHLRTYRRRARRRPVELAVTRTRTAAVIYTETAILPDGTRYQLTQTWVPPPTARETEAVATQT